MQLVAMESISAARVMSKSDTGALRSIQSNWSRSSGPVSPGLCRVSPVDPNRSVCIKSPWCCTLGASDGSDHWNISSPQSSPMMSDACALMRHMLVILRQTRVHNES